MFRRTRVPLKGCVVVNRDAIGTELEQTAILVLGVRFPSVGSGRQGVDVLERGVGLSTRRERANPERKVRDEDDVSQNGRGLE